MSGNVSNHVWVEDATKPLGGYWVREKGTADGAALVSVGHPGIARTRWIDVVHATAPTIAGSGTITYPVGVRGIVVDSIMVSAGTLPLVASNWTIRYAVDAANNAAAALLLPTTFPSGDPAAEGGQVGSFNVLPSYVPDTEAAGDLRVCQIMLPRPVEIEVSADITRLDFAHNLGAGVTVILGVRAVEVQS